MVLWASACLTLAMACLALAADLGYIAVTRSELQNAADSGAMSAARALPKGRAAAIAAAQLWAGKNEAAGSPVQVWASEDVEFGLWDDDTASFMVLPPLSSESPNAVRVICRRTVARGNPLNLFFAPFIGTNHAEITATALGGIARDRCGVIVGLNYVDVKNGVIDSYDSAHGSYAQQSPQSHGDVCSNGPITLGSSGLIKGNALPGPGFSVNSPSQVTGSTTPRLTQIKWKPVDMTGVTTNNRNSSIPKGYVQNGTLRLTGNTVLTLAPGTYYFPGGVDMLGTSQLNVTGKTRIILGGGKSTVSGNGIVNQTNLAANLRIDIVGVEAEFTGNSSLYADIYAPTADLTVNGDSGFYGAMFAKTVNLSGHASRVHGDESLRREYDETTRSKLKE